ncbi:60S ribosomal protein L18 [Ranunculus cassubicifolius]
MASSSSMSISFLQQSAVIGIGWSHSQSQQHGMVHLPNMVTLNKPKLSRPVEAKTRTRTEDRQARHARVRKKVEGTTERPRLCVFRSNKHMYVQVIDDTKMHTLASASTVQKPISEEFDYSSGPTIEIAKKVGEAIAKSCLEKGITKVAFDRGGYPYHGRISALADAAREHGLQF